MPSRRLAESVGKPFGFENDGDYSRVASCLVRFARSPDHYLTRPHLDLFFILACDRGPASDDDKDLIRHCEMAADAPPSVKLGEHAVHRAAQH